MRYTHLNIYRVHCPLWSLEKHHERFRPLHALFRPNLNEIHLPVYNLLTSEDILTIIIFRITLNHICLLRQVLLKHLVQHLQVELLLRSHQLDRWRRQVHTRATTKPILKNIHSYPVEQWPVLILVNQAHWRLICARRLQILEVRHLNLVCQSRDHLVDLRQPRLALMPKLAFHSRQPYLTRHW